MVARSRFVSTTDASGSADYYMRPTEDQETRDRDARALRLEIPREYQNHNLTIPRLKTDISPRMRQAMNVSRETPTREQVKHFLAGKTLSGDALPGRRNLARHTKSDGKEYKPKQYMDIILRCDPTVGILLAGSQTPEHRAIVLHAFHKSADEALALKFEPHVGITRKMIHGSKYEIPGEMIRIDFTHSTTRPTLAGDIFPCLHRHNVYANFILPEEHGPGAVHMKLMSHFHSDLGLFFQDRMEVNFKAFGIDMVRHPENRMAMVAEIPRDVRDGFMVRRKDIERVARAWAERRGIDYDSMTRKGQQWIERKTEIFSRSGKFDGVADSAVREGWRALASRLGWTARDVANPPLALSQREHSPSLAGMAREVRALILATRLRMAQGKPLLGPNALAQAMRYTQKITQSLSDTLKQLREQTQRITQTIRMKPTQIRDFLLSHSVLHAIKGLGQSLNTINEGIQKMSMSRTIAENQFGIGEYLANKYLGNDYAVNPGQLDATVKMVARGEMQAGYAAERVTEHASINYYPKNEKGVAAYDQQHGNREFQTVLTRMETAIADGVKLVESMTHNDKQGATVFRGPASGPIAFTTSLADAAMVRDTTGMTAVAAYTDENKTRLMHSVREANPNRIILNITNGHEPAQQDARWLKSELNAIPIAPKDNDWQSFIRENGTANLANAMREAYRLNSGTANVGVQKQTLSMER